MLYPLDARSLLANLNKISPAPDNDDNDNGQVDHDNDHDRDHDEYKTTTVLPVYKHHEGTNHDRRFSPLRKNDLILMMIMMTKDQALRALIRHQTMPQLAFWSKF